MRPKQKNTVWMKGIVQKFTKAVSLVVDAYAGTFFVAKDCLPLCKNSGFIGCEVDPSW